MDTSTELIGVAKQADRGALAAAPAFAHGLTSGGLQAAITQEPTAVTSAYRSARSARRSKVEPAGDLATLAFQKGIGIYLLAALGSVATTGAEAPYESVFTQGADIPYCSLWNKKGDGTILARRDSRLAELSLEWSENDALEVSPKFVGGVTTVAASFVPVVDESDADDFFTPVGGTFKYDLDGSTLATAEVLGGKVVLTNAAEPRNYSGSIEPARVSVGRLDVETALTIDPDDLDFWRELSMGGAAGTAISEDTVYGSLELLFVSGTSSLKVEAPRVAFLADIPEADPEGKPADVELSGLCYRVDDTPITVTLTNGQATY